MLQMYKIRGLGRKYIYLIITFALSFNVIPDVIQNVTGPSFEDVLWGIGYVETRNGTTSLPMSPHPDGVSWGEYGITLERVRQIKDKAIRNLRHNSKRLYELINNKR